jgi:hypothetical protein
VILKRPQDGTLDLKLPFGSRAKHFEISPSAYTIHSVRTVLLIPRHNGLYRAIIDASVVAGGYGKFNPTFIVHA